MASFDSYLVIILKSVFMRRPGRDANLICLGPPWFSIMVIPDSFQYIPVFSVVYTLEYSIAYQRHPSGVSLVSYTSGIGEDASLLVGMHYYFCVCGTVNGFTALRGMCGMLHFGFGASLGVVG